MNGANNKERQEDSQKALESSLASSEQAVDGLTDQDAVFLNTLRKKRRTETQERTFEKRWIYKHLRIFSPTTLEIPSVRYYKFPFSSSIKNDGSSIFSMLYAEWIKAAHSAYINFKRHASTFYLKLDRCILCFESDALWISEGFRGSLERSEIEYTVKGGWLCVERSEAHLVFDLIANFPVSRNSEMPFIISKHEFDGSSSYYTRINKKPAVRYRNTTQYHYEVDSYFVGADYSGFFMYNIDMESIM